VPESEKIPPTPEAAAGRQSLADRWRGRPKLSEASPKWIAVTAPLWALLGAFCASSYVAMASLRPGPGAA